MALLRTFENDEYLPEFGTVVLRDTFDPDARAALPPVGEMLGELATDALPGGSIARAGAGWLQASAGDGYHVVRLEAHDRAPADDRGAWEDVVETPYRSSIGSVGLAHMTSGPWNADIDLGGPGVYRVRVARRPAAEDGDVWRLQFWPTPAAVEPPRWLARHRPATRGGRSGWDEVLGYEATELAFMVRATAAGQPDGVTVARLQAWGTQHARSPGWLDEPLWRAPPTPLPTGHADLDAHAEDRRRSLLADAARRAGALAEVAAQLRVPPPATRRGLLELLVAAGLLTADDSGGPRRYGFVAQPRRAQEVLRLAPERVAMLERQDAMQRYVWLAAYAAAHPSRVRRLVLANALARFLRDAMEAEMQTHAGEPWYDDARTALDRENAGEYETPEELGELVRSFWPMYFARFDDGARRYAEQHLGERANPDALKVFNAGSEEWDARGELGAITAPTLVITGARDFITGPACAHDLADGIPGAHLVVVEDCGHFLFVECPQRWREEVTSFLT